MLHFLVRRVVNWFVVSCMIIPIAACQSIPVEKISANADPNQEIAATEVHFESTQKKHGEVLAPTSFAKAKARLDEAKEMSHENRSSEEILEKVAEARAYLKKSDETIKTAENVMPEVIEARSAALAAEKSGQDNKNLKSADKRLMDVTEDLEDAKTARALAERDQLKKEYLDVELAAINETYTSPVHAQRKRAREEGAEKNAPKSWMQSTNSVKEAETYITENRHNRIGIQEHVRRAQADADRLVMINREAKAMGSTNAEDLVLAKMSQEQMLARQKAMSDATHSKLDKVEKRLDTVEREKEDLAAEKAFNDQFIAAQAQFQEHEADVYRDENVLVIRMKSMQFGSGQAGLKAENFPLLNKVKNVVNDVAPARVTIEGHADSTGNIDQNIALSLRRADAVASYFKANGLNRTGIKLETKGMGDAHPIAPNNTAEGRAQNRRVDVLIQPERSGLTH